MEIKFFVMFMSVEKKPLDDLVRIEHTGSRFRRNKPFRAIAVRVRFLTVPVIVRYCTNKAKFVLITRWF